eukprot:TRINITY_DN19558_c0_g1_i1.p1 TRINITY_DN19558_c0_g1~~TRINITY_DN19558_c0_g1_i1.p1  ORF type:complete len:149 (-),score=32.04 TRINITY_DN19558_c0_g1_i1:48-494(-)
MSTINYENVSTNDGEGRVVEESKMHGIKDEIVGKIKETKGKLTHNKEAEVAGHDQKVHGKEVVEAHRMAKIEHKAAHHDKHHVHDREIYHAGTSGPERNPHAKLSAPGGGAGGGVHGDGSYGARAQVLNQVTGEAVAGTEGGLAPSLT